MRKLGYLVLMIALGAGVAAAQIRTPNYGQMYCSGVWSNEALPNDTYLISGEEARSQLTFYQDNYVYINRGSAQGLSVGDEFLVIRPVKRNAAKEWFAGNPFPTPDRPNWFKWESWLRRAMGAYWKDVGKVRVVKVHSDTAIAQIVHSCDYFQRGDYVRPFEQRTAPAFKAAKFDRWAPPSGRSTAQVVQIEEPEYYTAQAGTGNIIYVNLGSTQGVKAGDYFRVFRYQGTRDEMAYQHWGYQYKAWGFGKTPRGYSWKDLPREVVGEGMVLRTGPNSSTVLVTYSLREIYQGDYVEVEEPAPVVEEAPAPAPAPTPNRSPSVSCSTDRPRAVAGERVRVTAQASDPDGDALRYAWRTNGGQIVGSGSSVMLDTTGLAPGRYMVTGQASDGISAAADCSVEVVVQAAEGPAQASKANECLFRLSSAGVDNVCKRILDDVALRLKNDPQARLVVIGYADPAESGAARLSAQRAENAKAYLLSSGIADVRVDTRSAGGQVGAGRQNRRVDIVWVPAGATY